MLSTSLSKSVRNVLQRLKRFASNYKLNWRWKMIYKSLKSWVWSLKMTKYPVKRTMKEFWAQWRSFTSFRKCTPLNSRLDPSAKRSANGRSSWMETMRRRLKCSSSRVSPRQALHKSPSMSWIATSSEKPLRKWKWQTASPAWHGSRVSWFRCSFLMSMALTSSTLTENISHNSWRWPCHP